MSETTTAPERAYDTPEVQQAPHTEETNAPATNDVLPSEAYVTEDAVVAPGAPAHTFARRDGEAVVSLDGRDLVATFNGLCAAEDYGGFSLAPPIVGTLNLSGFRIAVAHFGSFRDERGRIDARAAGDWLDRVGYVPAVAAVTDLLNAIYYGHDWSPAHAAPDGGEAEISEPEPAGA